MKFYYTNIIMLFISILYLPVQAKDFVLDSTTNSIDKTLMLPTATISGGKTVCQNATKPLITFTGDGGTAPYTFIYKINEGTNLIVTTLGNNNSVTVSVETSNSGKFVYSLQSVSDSASPLVVTNVTGNATVEINSQPDATINGTGSGTMFGGVPVFRICNNAVSTFSFTNGSTTASTLNTNYTIVWGDGSPDYSSVDWTTPLTHTYQVGLWNIIYTIKSSNGCDITKKYIVFVGSNPAVSLGNPGNTDICNSSALTFPITGTTNNPPGTTYRVTFSDSSPAEIFTHPPPTSITHTFNTSSCGREASNGVTTFQNSFSANIVAENPCGASAVGVVPIYVSTPPIADFTLPATACVNKQICITNTSTGAYENNGSNSSCNTSPKFVWSISPSTGYTIVSGSLGNDFGSTDPNLWTTGTTPICINFVKAGTYTITIKTGNRCGFDTKVKTICIEPTLTPLFTLNKNSGCLPLAITTTNSTILDNQCSSPTYEWSITYAKGNCGTVSAFTYTGATSATSASPSFNFTEAGTYSIKVAITNSCGTVISAIQTVIVKKPPTASILTINDSCGAGSVSPTAIVNSCEPNTSNLTYAWSFPGGTPANSNSLIPGAIAYSSISNYTVSLIVTNECGVSNTASQSFSVNTAPKIINTNLSQSICSGAQTSLVTLNSDSINTTFMWTATATVGITGFSPSGNTSTIPIQSPKTTSSSSGTITYAITPSVGGCSGTIVNYVITINPAPTFASQPKSSSICQGGTASLLETTITNVIGTPLYQWYSNSVNDATTGTLITAETTASYLPPISSIGTIYYYCVITLPTSGCSTLISDVASVTITPPFTISLQPKKTQNLCVGATIISPLAVSYTGGSGIPSYQWFINSTNSNIGGNLITGAINKNYTPAVFNAPGTFYFYVQITLNGSGCGSVLSDVSEIIVTSDPVVTSEPLVSQTICQNVIPTPLNVMISGGISEAFQYQWYRNTINSNTNGTILLGETNSSYVPSSSTPGTTYYYCDISQSIGSGCSTISATAKVIVNLGSNFTSQPISSTICQGEILSQLSVTFVNGAGTPKYQWYSNTISDASSGIVINGATNSTYNPQNIIAGTSYYYCIITFPTGGCTNIISNIASVEINTKPLIDTKAEVICSGTPFLFAPETILGNVIPNGTTYTWATPIINPPNTIIGALHENIPQTNISQKLINISSSPSVVTYIVTPISRNCTGEAFTISVTVNPAINPNVTFTNNTCFGINDAKIDTNINGGIPFSSGAPYTISWSGPNRFTSFTTNITNLAPGNYDVNIVDAVGCPFSSSYVITEPDDIKVNIDLEKNITCFGDADGAINLSITGGTQPYTYEWTKNNITFSYLQDISNLDPAIYRVTVSDDNKCGPKISTFTIDEPAILELNLVNQINVLCYGDASGSIKVTVEGGTKIEISPDIFDYIFSWTGPMGFSSNNQNLSSIVAGNYNLTVTDANGCFKNIAVNITENPEIIVDIVTTPITCFGANNASIKLSVSGGIAPYIIAWDTLTTGTFKDNLSAGKYKITITDSKNCIKMITVNIPEALLFTVNPTVKNISCFGAKDGSINLNFVGGIPAINLTWSDGSTSGTVRNNLGPGTYSVTIVDGTPCTIQRTFTIVEPKPIVLSANLTDAFNCNNASSGIIDLIVAGGTPPFAYTWSNFSSTEDLNNITSGNYLVTVTDANGCLKTGQYSILRPDPLLIKATTETTFNCYLHEVKQNFIAQSSGGVPPYKFNWSSGTVSGANNEVMSTKTNGTILLTSTDSYGCNATYSVLVNTPKIGYATFDSTSYGYTTYGIYSISDPIQFTSTITEDYVSILWDFGDGTFSSELNPVHIYKNPKNYIVKQVVTYPFGCVYEYTISLLVEKGYLLVVPNAFTPNNDTLNDTFRPVTKGLKNVRLDIYDTWGSLLYSETGEVLIGWDSKIKGVNAENGNYYCKVSAETFYGTIINENHPFVLIK